MRHGPEARIVGISKYKFEPPVVPDSFRTRSTGVAPERLCHRDHFSRVTPEIPKLRSARGDLEPTVADKEELVSVLRQWIKEGRPRPE